MKRASLLAHSSGRNALRSASVASLNFSSIPPQKKSSNLITDEKGVHQNMKLSKSWRNKPLFRRQGDVRFKTGVEGAKLLVGEVIRRDPYEETYIDNVQSTMHTLSPIFDRNPKYAFVAKQLMEPERFIQFRVAWIDDTGVIRMNRGFRIQYNSALGPYEGPLNFGGHVNSSVIRSLGFLTTFSNSLTGFDVGGAAGGSDFNPLDKSEAEVQRFCQSYMTELCKYVGPDVDHLLMGMGVSEKELGYLFGQYKRLNLKASSVRKKVMVGDAFHAPGYAVAHYAHQMLQDRNDSLEGKRCLIVGSGKVARSLAVKLKEYGAIPLTFSDQSGFVYESNGFTDGQLRVLTKIKDERGLTVGRYIISSTTAKFNDPESIFDIPCDLCFPCGAMKEINGDDVAKLADNGCMGIIEGGHYAIDLDARKSLKKRGLLYGPHILTLTGAHIMTSLGAGATDEMLAAEIERIYADVKKTAQEFNARGDLFAGANIIGFLRIANAMMAHGAV